jgi:hypothetical protein
VNGQHDLMRWRACVHREPADGHQMRDVSLGGAQPVNKLLFTGGQYRQTFSCIP